VSEPAASELLARLREAIPPPELRAADVDAESQLNLTLALLNAARERRQEATAA